MMRRVVDRWWLVGCVLLAAAIALSWVLYVGDSSRRDEQERATQRQVVSDLSQSVADVLDRQGALAHVVGALDGHIDGRWPVLSQIVMSQSVANSAGFMQPVTQQDRAAFERRTGLRMVESPRPGEVRIAPARGLHLVLTAYRQIGPGPPPLGLDVAANPLRRSLLLRAARTGLQVASPPIDFLGRKQPTRGVAVYEVVRDRRGRLIGWVTVAYEAQQLAALVTSRMPGVKLTARDGSETLIAGPATTGAPAATIAVAGRRWSVWAEVPSRGVSAVPWLVLGLGLVLTATVMLILRQLAIRARESDRQLAARDVEEAAFGQIAALVAHGAPPDAVFTAVAEQIAKLFSSPIGSVSRFDEASGRGEIVGGWARDGQQIAGTTFALDGVTAAAEVFRTGTCVRTRLDGAGAEPPVAGPIGPLVARGGIACPITVAGQLWGALGAAHDEHLIPAGAERRLERFASLIGLAIANADAWDRLARQAASDPLTGIANRRSFDERLHVEIARARRHQRDLSLVLIDLDRFKEVNDAHGHPAGDRVLVLFAQLLSAHAREDELVARIGGEEFAWLMPETNHDGAYVAAERLRTAIHDRPFENVGTITLSAGICSNETAPDAETLLQHADHALYQAKDHGRNRTLMHRAHGYVGVAGTLNEPLGTSGE